MQGSKLQPALLGGLFIAVLSALPIISIGNCCCLWIIGGGMVAAYLLQQNQLAPIAGADGAVVGLLAGLVGAVFYLFLSIPIGLLFGPMQAEWMQRVMSSAGEVPPELRPMIEQMQQNAGFTVVGALLGFIYMVIVGVIFGSLGGFLGALFFKKDGPPPPTPPVPQNPFGGTPFHPPSMPPPPPPPPTI